MEALTKYAKRKANADWTVRRSMTVEPSIKRKSQLRATQKNTLGKNYMPCLTTSEKKGMEWWSHIEPAQRAYWLDIAASAEPADAWAAYKCNRRGTSKDTPGMSRADARYGAQLLAANSASRGVDATWEPAPRVPNKAAG